MLETIFGAMNDALAALADVFLKAVTDLISLDLGYFVQKFPLLGSAYALFQAIALGLVILLGGYALLKFFLAPANTNQIPPHMVLIRTLGAILMVYMGGYIFEMAMNMASNVYGAFVALGDGATSIFTAPDAGLAATIGTATGAILVDVILVVPALVELILSLVLLFVLFKAFFRLIAEILERYVLVGVLTFIAPLPCATLASPSTSQIFSRYLNMYFGQLLLMALSIFSYNLALSALAGMSAVGASAADVFIQVLLVVGCCKIGERMDTFMQQLGVGVGVTGGGMGEELIGVAMSAGRTLKSAFSGWNSAGEGGEDGTGHRSDNVLGGRRDSSGAVQPEPYGTGLFGAGVSAVKYGVAAAKAGGGVKDVASAAKKGARDGIGLGKDDVSILTGRRLNQKIQNTVNARHEASNPVTPETAGGVTMSGDRQHPVLDPTAERRGIKIGRNGTLEGSPQQVGRFMSANMGKQSAQDLIQNTARTANPAASEQALFGTHNNLTHGDKTEVGAREFDQAGSDMMMATFGDGLADLEQKADREALTPEEENLRDVGAAMAGSMGGDDSNGYLSDFRAHDIGEGGREVTADLKDGSGQTIGSVTAMDEKGYKALTSEQKQGFVPIKSSTGANYYMRASGATVSEDGSVVSNSRYGPVTPFATPSSQQTPETTTAPVAATAGAGSGAGTPSQGGGSKVEVTKVNTPSTTLPEGSPFVHKADGINISPNWEDTGVAIGRDGSKDIITGTDSAYTGAAINQAIVSTRTAEQRLVMDTLDSSALDKDAVREGLLNPDAGGIAAGHDAPVAKMVDKAFGADDIGKAAGRVKAEDGTPLMSKEAATNLGPAIQAASGAGTTVAPGYSCDNFKVEEGKTIYDYHTPDGDYQVEMAEFDPSAPSAANFEAGDYAVGMNITPVDAPANMSTAVSDYVPPSDPDTCRDALFNPSADFAPSQTAVAQMIDTGIGSDVAGGAVGMVRGEDGAPVISPEDSSHFGQAVRAAGNGEAGEAGYRCDSFAARDGVVSCDYHTPSGAYRVEMSQFTGQQSSAPSTQFSAGTGVYNITAAPIIATQDPAADMDPSNDDGHHGGKGGRKKKKRRK